MEGGKNDAKRSVRRLFCGSGKTTEITANSTGHYRAVATYQAPGTVLDTLYELA